MSDNPFLPPSSNLSSRETLGVVSGVNEKTLDGLRRTKGWAKFSGVMMIAMFGLQVLNLLLTVGGVTAAVPGQGKAFVIGGGVAGLIFGAIMYLWPAMRLLAYSKAITRLLETQSAGDLEEALNAQRGFWKHVGILVLIFIAIVVFAMLFGIFAAVSTAARMRP